MPSNRLSDLRPSWRSVIGFPGFSERVTVLRFMCPQCPRNADGFSHWIGVPVSEDGAPGTWKRDSEDFDALTISPSIDLTRHTPAFDSLAVTRPGCTFHGFVRGGNVE